MSQSREYDSWFDMRDRCRNPRHQAYPRYGGRGISVCDRWRDSFENFFEDMGPRPGKGYSIERIDNDGNYEPGNCKWGTRREQNRNRGNCYTPEQDAVILQMREDQYTWRQIGSIIGKSPGAVLAREARLRKRGIDHRMHSEKTS